MNEYVVVTNCKLMYLNNRMVGLFRNRVFTNLLMDEQLITATDLEFNFKACSRDTKAASITGTRRVRGVLSPRRQCIQNYLQPNTVCNFQSMKTIVELNSLLSKFFSYITSLLYHLIRRNYGQLANDDFMSNSILSLKQ